MFRTKSKVYSGNVFLRIVISLTNKVDIKRKKGEVIIQNNHCLETVTLLPFLYSMIKVNLERK